MKQNVSGYCVLLVFIINGYHLEQERYRWFQSYKKITIFLLEKLGIKYEVTKRCFKESF